MAKDHERSWKDLLGAGEASRQAASRRSPRAADGGVTLSPESWRVSERQPGWLLSSYQANDEVALLLAQEDGWHRRKGGPVVHFSNDGSVRRISLPSFYLSFCPGSLTPCDDRGRRLRHVQMVGERVRATLPLLLAAASMVGDGRSKGRRMAVGALACDDSPRGVVLGSVSVNAVAGPMYYPFGDTHISGYSWSSPAWWLTRSFASEKPNKLGTMWGFVATSLRLLVRARSILGLRRSLCGAFGTGVPDCRWEGDAATTASCMPAHLGGSGCGGVL